MKLVDFLDNCFRLGCFDKSLWYLFLREIFHFGSSKNIVRSRFTVFNIDFWWFVYTSMYLCKKTKTMR
jgi:hypothetical protein